MNVRKALSEIPILKSTALTYEDNNLRYFDLEQSIRPALERGDITYYLQPKVDLKTGEVTRAEALVRWIDPEKGMIPIVSFLPSLEENGLIGRSGSVHL